MAVTEATGWPGQSQPSARRAAPALRARVLPGLQGGRRLWGLGPLLRRRGVPSAGSRTPWCVLLSPSSGFYPLLRTFSLGSTDVLLSYMAFSAGASRRAEGLGCALRRNRLEPAQPARGSPGLSSERALQPRCRPLGTDTQSRDGQ